MATLDRDVRLTPNQMIHLDRLVRNRVSELGRKISRAEESRAAGNTIQMGTLQRHYEELGELAQVREALEVARRQIQHQIIDALGRDAKKAAANVGPATREAQAAAAWKHSHDTPEEEV